MAQETDTAAAEATAAEAPTAEVPQRRFARADSSFLREVTATDFPVSRRGYDRAAVNRYVERMTRIVAELEGRRSPDAAIERALADVGEETRAILRRARTAAEELESQANSEKERVVAQAEAQAKELREEAERYRELARKEGDETIAQAKAAAEQERSTAAKQAEETRAAADKHAEEARAAADKHAEETRAEADRYRDELRGEADRIARDRDDMLNQLRDLAEGLRRIETKARDRRPADEDAVGPAKGVSPTSLAPTDGSSHDAA